MVLSVVSGKGGVGKTVISASIAYSLAKLGRKTIVVDADYNFSNLDVVLGVEGEFAFNISDVINNNCLLNEAVFKVYDDGSLYFLPSARLKNIFYPDENKFIEIINNLNQEYEYVIIDCSSNADDIKRILSITNTALVVTTPDVLSVRDADSVISLAEESFDGDIKLIINKVNESEEFCQYISSADDILDKLGISLAGIIPESNPLLALINCDVLDFFKNQTVLTEVFENIARRILGENVPLTKFKKKEKSQKFNFFNHKK